VAKRYLVWQKHTSGNKKAEEGVEKVPDKQFEETKEVGEKTRRLVLKYGIVFNHDQANSANAKQVVDDLPKSVVMSIPISTHRRKGLARWTRSGIRVGLDERAIVSELLQRISCVALERGGYISRSWIDVQRLSVNANDLDFLFMLAICAGNKVLPEQTRLLLAGPPRE
jgi:hypothetical protein